MRRRVLIALLAVVAVVGTTVGMAMAGGNHTIRADGTESFQRNALIQSTFKFDPTIIYVKSGGSLTWEHRTGPAPDPHTISIVGKSDRPNSPGEVFNCRICGPLFHELDNHLRVNRGPAGLDEYGDQLVLLPGHSVSEKVSAPAGTTLYYICIIHPWMQGIIRVTH